MWSFVLYPTPEKRRRWCQRCLEYAVLFGSKPQKEEVLRRMKDVSLVHIAAHGDAERVEIALASNSSVTGVPMEDDFVLALSALQDSCGRYLSELVRIRLTLS